MRLIKWMFVIGLVGMLFCGPADAQTIMANKLCIHSGGEYFVNGPFYCFPNHGSMRYYPSFTHWASTHDKNYPPNLVYPWKIAGWAWEGMQGNFFGPTWYWESCLQYSVDNPWSTNMSFDYPRLFCDGTVPHSGFPMPIYGGTIPSGLGCVSGNQFIFPSSSGGFDAYMNIFAIGCGSWIIPTTVPFYGWQFGFAGPCGSPITIPSVTSIVEHVWMCKSIYNQYTILDGNTPDCQGGAGNKGRNYSLICDMDNGFLWGWTNGCTGVQQEWAQCLFVCDAVTIPVNVPGAPNAANPFVAYGFDVGAATLTPYLSSGCVMLGFMSEEYKGLGGSRIILGAFASSDPCIGPYHTNNYRIPHGWDFLTSLLLGIAPLFQHQPAPGYPACMFGTTVGDHSNFIPFPPDPALMCAEIRWSSYATNKCQPMSASYMVTYF